jgi:hypothetical protein
MAHELEFRNLRNLVKSIDCSAGVSDDTRNAVYDMVLDDLGAKSAQMFSMGLQHGSQPGTSQLWYARDDELWYDVWNASTQNCEV